ncbi:MAG: (2Fe-2S)-binding protein [Azonexus sp.]
MYLCICKTVTDRQVRQAVEQGLRTMGDLTGRFGVGIECGKCLDDVRVFLESCLSTLPAAAGSASVQDVEVANHPAAAQAIANNLAQDASISITETVQPNAVSEPPPERNAWFAVDL